MEDVSQVLRDIRVVGTSTERESIESEQEQSGNGEVKLTPTSMALKA